MLEVRSWRAGDGVSIGDVACRHPRGRGQASEESPGNAVVFVRRGCFVRSADGGDHLLDPTLALCTNAGEEQRYDHPHTDGDDCTAIFLSPDQTAALWGGVSRLPTTPLRVPPPLDLRHRLLLAAARRNADQHELGEAALGLAADVLAGHRPAQVASGRPATARARAALADGVRERLAVDPEWSLQDLARALAVSPHHLSRTFRAATGETIARHRLRIRARRALELLAGGERDLAWVAADAGFADQSHLCRVLGAETQRTPSWLRAALAPR
jgi:AraC-like DNA-binding protein